MTATGIDPIQGFGFLYQLCCWLAVISVVATTGYIFLFHKKVENAEKAVSVFRNKFNRNNLMVISDKSRYVSQNWELVEEGMSLKEKKIDIDPITVALKDENQVEVDLAITKFRICDPELAILNIGQKDREEFAKIQITTDVQGALFDLELQLFIEDTKTEDKGLKKITKIALNKEFVKQVCEEKTAEINEKLKRLEGYGLEVVVAVQRLNFPKNILEAVEELTTKEAEAWHVKRRAEILGVDNDPQKVMELAELDVRKDIARARGEGIGVGIGAGAALIAQAGKNPPKEKGRTK